MKKTLAVAWMATLLAGPAAAQPDVPGLDVNGQCVGDADGDGRVEINELILAVNNSLDGCPARPVTLQFAAAVDHDEFACGSVYGGIGLADGQFVPSDFRFYVSDVRLLTPAGDEVPVTLEPDGIWQYENVALLDFENGSGPCSNGNQAVNTTVRGSVPAGAYTGVAFTLGLPFALNHGDASTAPAPLNFTAMFWSWQAGYKFLRIDTADDKFRIHLGATGCESAGPSRPPSSCAYPNRASVALTDFDPDADVIVADLAALLSGNDVDANHPGTPPGCMSDPGDDDCAALFSRLGIDFADGTPRPGQSFFRVGAGTPGQP